MTAPTYRTNYREGAIRFLKYLLHGLETGQIASYYSTCEPDGIGHHRVTTADASVVPFDLSDIEDEPILTSPETPQAKAALLDPPEPKE